MSESDRPESGSRRPSSIEVRIPQATSQVTDNEVFEPEPNQSAVTVVNNNQAKADTSEENKPSPEEDDNQQEPHLEEVPVNINQEATQNQPLNGNKERPGSAEENMEDDQQNLPENKENADKPETSENGQNQKRPIINDSQETSLAFPPTPEIVQTTTDNEQQNPININNDLAAQPVKSKNNEDNTENIESPVQKPQDAPDIKETTPNEPQHEETDQIRDEDTQQQQEKSLGQNTQESTGILTENKTQKQESSVDEATKETEENKSTVACKDMSAEDDRNTVSAKREQNNEKDEARRSSTPKSPRSHNLEAMKAALDTSKQSGFILSSQFEENKDGRDETENEQLPPRELPEGEANEVMEAKPKHKLATTSVRFQTGQSSKDKDEKAYMTETLNSEFAMQDGRESRESRTYSPAYFDTGGRRSPEGGAKSKKTKKDSKRAKLLEKLNLSKPPEKFVLKLKPLKRDPDPSNKAPLNPNIYYAEVPKEGGNVKTPFYMQVEIPNGALDGNVRLKFEKQEFDRMKLGLTEDDMLCSYIVDLNMDPPSYCLRKNATLKMRILDKCMNIYEDTMILMARHFTWSRIPTRIESRDVNGEKHYYAVTNSQSFGKFAVINSKRMDRFIIATAGGVFKSTLIPEIQLRVEDNYLSHHSPQMIEMLVKETRDEAVKKINKEILSVKGVEGRLVAASPLIEITKNLMGQTGRMKHGMRFPDKLSLILPLPIPPQSTDGALPKRNVIIMQKHTNIHPNTGNGVRYLSDAYSKNSAHLWKDVTKSSKMAVDMVNFDSNETLPIQVSIPGKYMVLVFEEPEFPVKNELEIEFDLDDLTNAVVESNQEFAANIMIHQKVSQPNIIFIHMVTADAISPIHETMKSTNAWKQVYVSRELFMHEWQPIKIEFKGDLKPTINQMSPQIRFYSRRWQGYQIQLEATDDAFSSSEENFTGQISFTEQTDKTIQKTKSTISLGSDDDHLTLCTADLEIERKYARPYKPTVVKKTIPKATIYREYKMKWLEHLSEEEIERYRNAHGI
ncbi:uncharacterized protein LOC144430408 [Styela clava]